MESKDDFLPNWREGLAKCKVLQSDIVYLVQRPNMLIPGAREFRNFLRLGNKDRNNGRMRLIRFAESSITKSVEKLENCNLLNSDYELPQTKRIWLTEEGFKLTKTEIMPKLRYYFSLYEKIMFAFKLYEKSFNNNESELEPEILPIGGFRKILQDKDKTNELYSEELEIRLQLGRNAVLRSYSNKDDCF